VYNLVAFSLPALYQFSYSVIRAGVSNPDPGGPLWHQPQLNTANQFWPDTKLYTPLSARWCHQHFICFQIFHFFMGS